MPWDIKITNFSERHRQDASYEPELHPGVTYRLKTPKATLKIFSTGSVTVTCEENEMRETEEDEMNEISLYSRQCGECPGSDRAHLPVAVRVPEGAAA